MAFILVCLYVGCVDVIVCVCMTVGTFGYFPSALHLCKNIVSIFYIIDLIVSTWQKGRVYMYSRVCVGFDRFSSL